MQTRFRACVLCGALERVSGQSEPGAKRIFMPCGTTVDSLAVAECKNVFPLFSPATIIKEELKRMSHNGR